jgi:WD40 repeat protein
MSNTKGHIAALTDGEWHPTNESIFMTTSLDCSIRLWDTESKLVGVD